MDRKLKGIHEANVILIAHTFFEILFSGLYSDKVSTAQSRSNSRSIQAVFQESIAFSRSPNSYRSHSYVVEKSVYN